MGISIQGGLQHERALGGLLRESHRATQGRPAVEVIVRRMRLWVDGWGIWGLGIVGMIGQVSQC